MDTKNLQIVGQPYVYENAFKNDKGEIINYSRLAVDVKVGETTIRLTHKLTGFEKEYFNNLISADQAFNEGD